MLEVAVLTLWRRDDMARAWSYSEHILYIYRMEETKEFGR